MDNAKTTLFKILEIIDYQDNKEKFVEEFLKNLQLQSFLDLMQALPEDKRPEIEKQLQNASNNPGELASKIKTYFNEEQLKKSLENTTKNALANYIQAIQSSLSVMQKDNLAKLF